MKTPSKILSGGAGLLVLLFTAGCGPKEAGGPGGPGGGPGGPQGPMEVGVQTIATSAVTLTRDLPDGLRPSAWRKCGRG